MGWREPIRCIYFPRQELGKIKEQKELLQPSLYLLFGGDKEVYIGRTDNFLERINNHKGKEFWGEGLVFSCSNEGGLSEELRYLEALSYKVSKEADNYKIENSQEPSFPSIPQNRKDIAEKYFKQIQFLCNFLGYDVFKIYSDEKKSDQPSEYWYCKSGGIDAIAIYKGTEMIVLKGSKIKKETKGNYGSSGSVEQRNKDIQQKNNNFRRRFLYTQRKY